jgi:hypothetical protein
MNDLFWTAIRIPEVIDPLSEYGIMYTRFPKHRVITDAEGIQFALFVTSMDEPIDPLYVVQGEDEELRSAFDRTVAYLTDEIKSAVLTKGLAEQFYNTYIIPTLIQEL